MRPNHHAHRSLFMVVPALLALLALLCVHAGCGSDDDDPAAPGTAPTAAFVGQPTAGAPPLSVAFTDQSTAGPTGWTWDFGDGDTSNQQHPTHVYAAAGTYTVGLTVTNAHGTDTETKAGYITANAGSGPVPVLERILPLGAGSGMTVTLHGRDFGDGTAKASAVMFGGVAATSYPSWLDDEIEVVVPLFDPPSAETAQVTVVVDGRVSNAVNFYRQDENVIRLTDSTVTDWQPSWGNNSTIYFASFATGNFNIWYMDADGGDPVQRTFFTEGQTDMPAYEVPNLYYRSNHDGDWDIYVSSGQGNEAPITSTPEKDFEVVIAPDLAPYQIALSRAEEHNGGTIWNIYGYGSSGLEQISDNMADFHPTFSPNGQQVAYMHKWGDFSNGQIMVVSVHGGDSVLISDPDEHCAYPTWNWAYDKIAYAKGADLFMCNPDGTDEVHLTHAVSNIVYPSWSPDGKRLAYAMFTRGSYELYVIDVSGILTAP